MNFKVFLLIFALSIFLSKYPPIFSDISDISIKSKYRYIRNYRYFVPCVKVICAARKCADLVSRSTITHTASCLRCVRGKWVTKIHRDMLIRT